MTTTAMHQVSCSSAPLLRVLIIISVTIAILALSSHPRHHRQLLTPSLARIDHIKGPKNMYNTRKEVTEDGHVKSVTTEITEEELLAAEQSQENDGDGSYNTRKAHNTIKFAAAFSNFTSQSMLTGLLPQPNSLEQSAQVLETIFWFTGTGLTVEELYQNEHVVMYATAETLNIDYGITGMEYETRVSEPTFQYIAPLDGWTYNETDPFVVTFKFSRTFHYFGINGKAGNPVEVPGPNLDVTSQAISKGLFDNESTIDQLASPVRSRAVLGSNCFVLAYRFEDTNASDSAGGGIDTSLPMIYNKLTNATTQEQLLTSNLPGCFKVVVSKNLSMFDFLPYSVLAAQRQSEYDHHKIGFMVALILILVVFGLAFWLGHVFTLDRREVYERDIKSSNEGTWTTSSKSSRSSASSRASSSSLSSSAPSRKLTAPRNMTMVPKMPHNLSERSSQTSEWNTNASIEMDPR